MSWSVAHCGELPSDHDEPSDCGMCRAGYYMLPPPTPLSAELGVGFDDARSECGIHGPWGNDMRSNSKTFDLSDQPHDEVTLKTTLYSFGSRDHEQDRPVRARASERDGRTSVCAR